MGKGGGGSQGAGKIEYPPYLTNMQSFLLYGSDLSGKGVDGNTKAKGYPYGYEPSDTSVIGLIMNKVVSLSTWNTSSPISKIVKFDNDTPTTGGYVSLPDPDTYLSGTILNFNQLETLVDNLSDNTVLDDAQDALETATESAYLRGINRFSAGMSDINATNSSAYFFGLALLESGHQRQIVEKRAEWAQQDRYNKLRAQEALTRLDLEIGKTKLVAKMDRLDKIVQYRTQSELWDLELYEYGSNMLAAIAGAVSTKNKTGKTLTSVLAGSLTGAAGGAMIGSMMAPANATGMAALGGPWALGIGAVLGGLFGLLSD